VKKETSKSREEAFVYMFYDRAGQLDDFAFVARELRRDALTTLETHIVMSSLIFRLALSHTSSHTSSRALSHFSHKSNHHSYDFGSRENNFMPRRFGYGPRPHRGDHFPRRPDFPAGGSHTHFGPRQLDGSRFPHRGSRPTGPSGELLKTVKTSSGCMVKC
jgi:hypothetical protein